MSSAELEREVDTNFDSFLDRLKEMLPMHRGEYVLMRRGQPVDFYADAHDALAAGRSRFTDDLYSIQEVTDRPVDLGFFSHAVNPRIA